MGAAGGGTGRGDGGGSGGSVGDSGGDQAANGPTAGSVRIGVSLLGCLLLGGGVVALVWV